MDLLHISRSEAKTLSSTEKSKRRQLQNKISAQRSRDKKKLRMFEMEESLNAVKKHNSELESRNAFLEQENKRLMNLLECNGISNQTSTIKSAVLDISLQLEMVWLILLTLFQYPQILFGTLNISTLMPINYWQHYKVDLPHWILLTKVTSIQKPPD